LNKAQLSALHSNPSFNVPESEMQEALHLLEPPPRHELVEEVRALCWAAARVFCACYSCSCLQTLFVCTPEHPFAHLLIAQLSRCVS
jgi:hypothetical protein